MQKFEQIVQILYAEHMSRTTISREHTCLQSSSGRPFDDLTTLRREFNGACVTACNSNKTLHGYWNLKLATMKRAADCIRNA